MLVGNESTAYWTRTYGLAPVNTLVKMIADAVATNAATARDRRDNKRVTIENSAKESSQPAADTDKAVF